MTIPSTASAAPSALGARPASGGCPATLPNTALRSPERLRVTW